MRINVFVLVMEFGLKEFFNGISSKGINDVINYKNGEGLYWNYKGVLVIGVYWWLEYKDLVLLVEID